MKAVTATELAPSSEVTDSKAVPTVYPVFVAFVATPGIDDGAKRSPTAIGPPSRLTRTGTRPVKATGTFLAAFSTFPLNPPRTRPGAVETTPMITGATVEVTGEVPDTEATWVVPVVEASGSVPDAETNEAVPEADITEVVPVVETEEGLALYLET